MKTTENFLRGAILTGIFAIPFLAFVVSTSLFFPFITGKNFGFRIIVEVIFALWILLAYANEAYRPKFSWIMATSAFFVAVVFLADIFGVNPTRSLWSNFERMEGFVSLIHVFAYFIVVGSVLTKDLWLRFLQTSIGASVIMALYGWIQYAGGAEINQGGVRLDGRFGNAAYLGGYLLFNAFLTAFLMTRTKKYDWLWWTYSCAIILQIVIMFLTETRGSMLGLFVGISVSSLLFIFLNKKQPALKWIAVGAVSFVALFMIIVFQFKNTDFIKNSAPLSRLASISLTESTVASRFMVWNMALEGFKERPILGWGQDNFNVVFNKYYNPDMYNQEQWFDRAHDIFLDWLIAAGFFGLFSYLLLFILGVFFVWEMGIRSLKNGWINNLKHTWKRYVSGEEENQILEKSILTGLFAAYFVHNIFVFDNLFSYILFFTILAFLHGEHVRGIFPLNGSVKKIGKKNDELPLSYVAIPVVCVLVTVLYMVNIKPILAGQTLIEGMTPHPNTTGQNIPTKENLDSFKKVIEYDTFVTSEAREQMVQLALRVKSTVSDAELKQQFFDFAKEQILSQIQEQQGDARTEMFAGTLFLQYGMNNEALAHFGEAHRLSPKKQTISFNLVFAYLNAGQKDKALTLAKETYELALKNQDAAKIYVAVLIHTGNQKSADELLLKTFGTVLVYDEDLINAYATTKNFDRVISILKDKLKEGEDPQLQIRLAAAYLAQGNRALAITEIQKVINVHPEFKAQGEYYIQQIRSGKNLQGS